MQVESCCPFFFLIRQPYVIQEGNANRHLCAKPRLLKAQCRRRRSGGGWGGGGEGKE